MARKKPPQYPIDGTPVYIPDGDSAWDHQRLRREIDAIEEDESVSKQQRADKIAEHPYTRYRVGDTRYRLESVDEYLDESKDPEKWHLKQPPPEVMREVSGLHRKSRMIKSPEADAIFDRCALLAFRHGIRKVENTPFRIRLDPEGAVDDRTIGEIDSADPGLVTEIGSAVMLAFRPLGEGEGK